MATLRSSTSELSSQNGFNAERIGKSIRTSATILLVGLVLLLSARRLSGAVSEPVSTLAYFLLGFIFAATAFLLRKSLYLFDETWIWVIGTVIAVVGALSVSFS